MGSGCTSMARGWRCMLLCLPCRSAAHCAMAVTRLWVSSGGSAASLCSSCDCLLHRSPLPICDPVDVLRYNCSAKHQHGLSDAEWSTEYRHENSSDKLQTQAAK